MQDCFPKHLRVRTGGMKSDNETEEVEDGKSALVNMERSTAGNKKKTSDVLIADQAFLPLGVVTPEEVDELSTEPNAHYNPSTVNVLFITKIMTI